MNVTVKLRGRCTVRCNGWVIFHDGVGYL